MQNGPPGRPASRQWAFSGRAETSSLPRGFNGEVAAYCEHPNCPARTVTLEVKNYDASWSGVLQCPMCHQTLKLHHTKTAGTLGREYRAERYCPSCLQRATAHWLPQHCVECGGPMPHGGDESKLSVPDRWYYMGAQEEERKE